MRIQPSWPRRCFPRSSFSMRLSADDKAVNVASWHITKSCCNANIGGNRGIADMVGPAVGSTRSRLTQSRSILRASPPHRWSLASSCRRYDCDRQVYDCGGMVRMLGVFRSRAGLFVAISWLLFVLSIPICLAIGAMAGFDAFYFPTHRAASLDAFDIKASEYALASAAFAAAASSIAL